jgi:putative nucleotidyltransferase with HDIG domain
MVRRGVVIGALSVQSFRPYAFDVMHLHFLESRAAQVALGLENTRLFEEIARQLRRVQSLHAIDRLISGSIDLDLILDNALSHVTAQLNVDAACILLYNPITQTLDYMAEQGFRTSRLHRTHLRLGEGGAGKAAQERRLWAISDLSRPGTGSLAWPSFREEGFISNYAVPLITKGQLKGVLEVFHRGPLQPDENWLEFLEALSGQAAIAIDNAELFNHLQIANSELTQAYDATIEGWSRALDLRDKETEGHSQRVTELTLLMAQAVGVPDKDLIHIRRGALLHDIGKMGLPDSILLKPGPLTPGEWEVMYRHPTYAYEMLFPIPYLRPALDIPYCHHEKWDGSGYPRRLKGALIPLAARLFAIVDVWDALSSDRPYRSAWPRDKALAYLQEQSGKHFDPDVVALFFRVIQSLPEGEFI